MTEKHTPGPWRWDGTWLDGAGVYFIARTGHRISDADKALIAAAPDLLEALKMALDCERSIDDWRGVSRAIAKANAAIAKAEGKD